MKYYVQFNGEYSGSGFIMDAKDVAIILPIMERCPRATMKYNADKHMREHILERGHLPSAIAIPMESIVLPQGSIRDTVAIIQDYPTFMKEVQRAQKELADAAEQNAENARRAQEVESQAIATPVDVPF